MTIPKVIERLKRRHFMTIHEFVETLCAEAESWDAQTKEQFKNDWLNATKQMQRDRAQRLLMAKPLEQKWPN